MLSPLAQKFLLFGWISSTALFLFSAYMTREAQRMTARAHATLEETQAMLDESLERERAAYLALIELITTDPALTEE